jgi:hypothetical protein
VLAEADEFASTLKGYRSAFEASSAAVRRSGAS